tara:strand:- start:1822 stop:1995 length:174 start_codon:yes stop_codon:yes gene_type:complete
MTSTPKESSEEIPCTACELGDRVTEFEYQVENRLGYLENAIESIHELLEELRELMHG